MGFAGLEAEQLDPIRERVRQVVASMPPEKLAYCRTLHGEYFARDDGGLPYSLEDTLFQLLCYETAGRSFEPVAQMAFHIPMSFFDTLREVMGLPAAGKD